VLWSVVGGTLSVSERYLFEGDAVRFFEDATAFGADLDATSSVCGAPLATFGAAPPFCTDRSRDGRAPLEVEDAAAAGFVFFDLLTSSPGDASFLGGDALLARFAEDGLLEGALATSDLEAGGSARTTFEFFRECGGDPFGDAAREPFLDEGVGEAFDSLFAEFFLDGRGEASGPAIFDFFWDGGGDAVDSATAVFEFLRDGGGEALEPVEVALESFRDGAGEAALACLCAFASSTSSRAFSASVSALRAAISFCIATC